ncbi:hypothetical protein H6F86_15075 [Phormidium sp. FACHB-592]|uniref:Uncharacterized protein n=1 Tax=Stenomitos frigidus AS-A4 TaxID=2933935 RepID=A0ABV0KSC9_9CYAN|nr:hypothetical protein [Phormidium sp. FACHB-592]MBD2075193.1 hypothetical protein [Phormidium sp. FACHB-592]
MKVVTKPSVLSLLLIATIQTPSIAGGSSWKVSIEKMQVQSSTRAAVVLKALEERAFDRQCTRLLVEIDYRSGSLRGQWKLPSSRENTALKAHQAALAALQTEYSRQSPLYFGEMIGGLAQKQTNDSWLDSLIQSFLQLLGKEDPPLLDSSIPSECRFTASGLAGFDEADGEQVAYVLNEL